MSIELQPIGTSCNSACRYCYQEPMRDSGNVSARGKYDIDLMISRGLSMGNSLIMYGGEALLVPKVDLEKVFKASYEKTALLRQQIEAMPESENKHIQLRRLGGPGVQTNGDLIDDDHIAMFKRYNVGVGVSIDGPGILNSLRVRRSDDNWQEPTEKTLSNIVKMRENGISVSIIVTLHRVNGMPDKLPTLKKWGLWLRSIGISSVNVHTFESENAILKYKYALPQDIEHATMLDLAGWIEENKLRWVPFVSIKEMLAGDKENANCTWQHCDPLTTPAVQAVLADGSLTNCGRTAKEGIPWVKAATAGYERYISLYQTPQDMNGCKDCRFFLFCGGHCPGEGENQDWRQRTDHCHSLMALFEFYEKMLVAEGKSPVSLSDSRKGMEMAMLHLFKSGVRPSSLGQLELMAKDDKFILEGIIQDGHGDSPHGDSPHGDMHGDSDHGDAHEDSATVHGDSGHVKSWEEYTS